MYTTQTDIWFLLLSLELNLVNIVEMSVAFALYKVFNYFIFPVKIKNMLLLKYNTTIDISSYLSLCIENVISFVSIVFNLSRVNRMCGEYKMMIV